MILDGENVSDVRVKETTSTPTIPDRHVTLRPFMHAWVSQLTSLRPKIGM